MSEREQVAKNLILSVRPDAYCVPITDDQGYYVYEQVRCPAHVGQPYFASTVALHGDGWFDAACEMIAMDYLHDNGSIRRLADCYC